MNAFYYRLDKTMFLNVIAWAVLIHNFNSTDNSIEHDCKIK